MHCHKLLIFSTAGKGRATKSDEFLEKCIRGEGSFSIQKFMVQIWNPHIEIFSDVFLKKLQHNFPKMRGRIKGRLNFFRKLIHFGSLNRPLKQSYTHERAEVLGGWFLQHFIGIEITWGSVKRRSDPPLPSNLLKTDFSLKMAIH